MGWTGFELEIPAGMLFKRLCCDNCGARLKKQRIVNLYKKGEPEFQNHLLGHPTIGMTRIKKVSFVYICPHCGKITSYEDQLKLSDNKRRHDKGEFV